MIQKKIDVICIYYFNKMLFSIHFKKSKSIHNIKLMFNLGLQMFS